MRRSAQDNKGWANVTGQVTLVCGIDFTCAQMITTAIAVNSDGTVVLSSGATFGILLAIVFSHGIVCSAATRVLARLNLFYVFVNGEPVTSWHHFACKVNFFFQLVQQLPPLPRCSCCPTATELLLLTRLHYLKTTRGGVIVSSNLLFHFSFLINTSHRWVGVHAGLYVANVDLDRLYVTFLGLLTVWQLSIEQLRRFCCPHIWRNIECCSGCSICNFSFGWLHCNLGMAPSNFGFFCYSLREWSFGNDSTSSFRSSVT